MTTDHFSQPEHLELSAFFLLSAALLSSPLMIPNNVVPEFPWSLFTDFFFVVVLLQCIVIASFSVYMCDMLIQHQNTGDFLFVHFILQQIFVSRLSTVQFVLEMQNLNKTLEAFNLLLIPPPLHLANSYPPFKLNASEEE